MESNKMGVLYVVAHLVITLAVIGAYMYTVVTGVPDETFKIALIAIIGYWFGAMDKANIKDLSKRSKDKKGA